MKKIRSFITGLRMTVAVSAALMTLDASARNYSDWMAELPDEAYVCTLSIPGTHDSATGNGFSGILASTYATSGQTQDHTVIQQMEMGVRAFDFRPGNKNNRLRCYHGMAEIDYWFDDAIRDICTFLKNHPDEFFVIHLYKSTDKLNSGISDLMNALIGSDDVKDHICSFRPDLKVKDMRGKILFMKRWEVDWSSDKIAYLWDWSETGFDSNEHFVKNGWEDQKCRIVMQDKANTKSSEKIAQFRSLFEYSSSYWPSDEKNMVWTMNFASSYDGSTSSAKTYCKNASEVLPAIIDMLETTSGPMGIVLADWVGNNKHSRTGWSYYTRGEDLVHAIADNNFRYIDRLVDGNQSISGPLYTDRQLDGLVSDKMFRGNMEWIDVSDNGMPDLVVKGRDLNDWWPKYYALPNNGSDLGAALYLPRPGSNEYDDNRSRIVVPIDYNADGKVDLLYGCANGTQLLRNDGNGEFTHMENFTLYGQEIDLDANGDNTIENRGAYGLMLTADFDMDGYPDILTYARGDNNTDGVPFMYRNESRDFGCAFFGKNCAVPALRNGSMAIGDFNLDGRPDVLISGVNNDGKRQISICLNTGFNDYFNFDVITPEELQPYATDFGAVGFVDVNNDGLPDLFVSGRLRDNDHISSYAANIFINNGDGTFSKPYTPACGAWKSGMDWCDINGDGYADIIYGGDSNLFAGCDKEGDKAPHYTRETSVILLNRGDGTFFCDNTTIEPLRSGVTVRAFDYNNTGEASIAIMGYGAKTFHLYEPAASASDRGAVRSDGVNASFTATDNGTTLITWEPSENRVRYNYAVRLKKDIDRGGGALISAIPVDVETGTLLQANVDAATTGNSVELQINPDDVESFGVQTISQAKKGGQLIMRPAHADISTGITANETDGLFEPVEYYNMQGMRISTPSHGVFIEKRGHKVTRRIIR